MLLHCLDDLRRARALADHALDALCEHRRRVGVHTAARRRPRRADRIARLCRRRSEIVNNLIVPVHGQRLALCKGFRHRLVCGITRADDRSRNQNTVARLELTGHFLRKRSGNTDTFRH